MTYRLVTHFADDMARALEENSYKSGWENLSPRRCLQRAEQEMRELRSALEGSGSFSDIRGEAADVANFLAMLIWNLCVERREKNGER